MYKQFISAAVVTLIFILMGTAAFDAGFLGYGSTMFSLIPFAIGFILGGKNVKWISIAGVALILLIFGLLLILGELEGMICVLFAVPYVVIAVALGFLIKWLYVKWKKKEESKSTLKLSVISLVLVLFVGAIEHRITENQHHEATVSSSVNLPYSTLDVYDAIKSVDTLDAAKPFLMKLDLPVPQKCVLEAEEVGATRTCYFEGGTVTQQITALEPGQLIDMEVIDYQLTGRKWLAFTTASYTFEELPDGHCKVVRNTSYTSDLYPRFYWEPLERIALEQEHEYVLMDLEKRLSNED